MLLAWGYHRFAGALAVRRGAAHGAVFGCAVFGLFVLVHEVFYFQFIAMSTRGGRAVTRGRFDAMLER